MGGPDQRGVCLPAAAGTESGVLFSWPTPGELESLTIGELASAAGVSEPTVIRCVRGLGYRGYRAFKGALRGREAGEESSFDHLGASPSGPGIGWRTCR